MRRDKRSYRFSVRHGGRAVRGFTLYVRFRAAFSPASGAVDGPLEIPGARAREMWV